ncbi:MAG: tetratricopeptide repeat protein [Actinomycetota bacterium]|nr:tetratricopeptide repeat protein [Actinomycetota bacterium]
MRQTRSGESSPFGRGLRRAREERGLSLTGLATLVHYSRGYIGKVETGDKPPTAELARRCDDALEAGGLLIGLVPDNTMPRFAQLPAAAATFVGRRAQLDHLEQALTSPGVTGAPRVVAIDGPPGAGKTAMALRLAHEIKDRFVDGQLYVDLRAYSPEGNPARPATVLEEFLVALGVQTKGVPDGVEQRSALYRSLLDGRRVLLVLDNALDTSQVEPLLPASDGCGVILTSRNSLARLDVSQDHRTTLGPMTEDESTTLLRNVIGDARVDEEPSATRALALRCGRLPLALRIAAERVATHPHHRVHDLVEELTDEQDRLDALATEDSHAIRTVFSWSYRDLSGEAARLFRLLGLHPGPHISVGAAAALADLPTPSARRVLDRLVSVHLLEGAPNDRYQVHDLLRVYAAEQTIAEEPEAERNLATRRLLEWYLHTTYAANGVLAPQRPNPSLSEPQFLQAVPQFSRYEDALSWCERELPNLVAATQLAVDIAEYETAWKLPAGLWNFLFLRKRWSSWITSHEVGLTGARRGGDRLGEAWLLNNVALAKRELRRFDEARTHLEHALAIRRDIGDQVGEAWTLTALGFLDTDLGQFGAAVQRFHQTLALREEIARTHGDDVTTAIGNLHGTSIALANLGVAFREMRRYEDALGPLHRALDIARDINDRHGESYTLIKLSDTYRQQGRVDEALTASAQALNIRRDIGDHWGEAEVLHHQGYAWIDSGQPEQAARAWQQASDIFEELGDPRARDVRAELAHIAHIAHQRREPSSDETG